MDKFIWILDSCALFRSAEIIVLFEENASYIHHPSPRVWLIIYIWWNTICRIQNT
jgi:hypothetical protein